MYIRIKSHAQRTQKPKVNEVTNLSQLYITLYIALFLRLFFFLQEGEARGGMLYTKIYFERLNPTPNFVPLFLAE